MSVYSVMKKQPHSLATIDPSMPSPSAVLDAVTRLVAAYPCGIACHPSMNAMHQIIEEIPATLDFARAELIVIAPPMSTRIDIIAGLDTVAWHFTDEDGKVHVTLSGSPEFRLDGTNNAVPRLGHAHQELVLADSDRLLGPNVLVTRLRSIRLEVPAQDFNVLIEVEVVNAAPTSGVAMAS